jgi:hypothetical protein
MAEGFTAAGANTVLDALITAYPYLKLHVGAPGASGTDNPATETTRKNPTFSAASAGATTNSAAASWTSVAASEDYTHVSGWTASSGGTCGWTGTITANAVTAGDNFDLPIGDVDLSLPLAS